MNSEDSKENLSGKELYEKKKQEKIEGKSSSQGKQPTRKKLLKPLIIGGLVALAIYGIWSWISGLQPNSVDQSVEVEVMEAKHIQPGNEPEVYTSNPPTSGPHYGQTAKAGFRTEEIPDQNILHNLEHGDIWISYKPSVSKEAVEELKKFAGGKVIITPRSSNDTDIALAAWGRLDIFNLPNGRVEEAIKERISDFILRHKLKGPEFITTPSTGI